MVHQKGPQPNGWGLFAAPSPSGRLQRSRRRSASARGDRSLKTLRRSVFLTHPLMVHQDKPYGSVGLIFLHHAPGKQAFVHHRGREQLVPAVPRPGWQKRPCGAFLERGRVPDGAPKRSSAEWLGTFCCTIPFGAASAFAQALCFSARARRWNHPIKPSFTAGL